jgi:hypothetical protein
MQDELLKNGVLLYSSSEQKEGPISKGQPLIFSVIKEIPEGIDLSVERQRFRERIETDPSGYKLSFHDWLKEAGVVSLQVPVVEELARETKSAKELACLMSLFGIKIVELN